MWHQVGPIVRRRIVQRCGDNPHPAFTQIEGITEPFDPARPPPIAPLILTPEEVKAISSFVSRMPAKDLGGGVEAR